MIVYGYPLHVSTTRGLNFVKIYSIRLVLMLKRVICVVSWEEKNYIYELLRIGTISRTKQCQAKNETRDLVPLDFSRNVTSRGSDPDLSRRVWSLLFVDDMSACIYTIQIMVAGEHNCSLFNASECSVRLAISCPLLESTHDCTQTWMIRANSKIPSRWVKVCDSARFAS
jgi:hypothetical protein